MSKTVFLVEDEVEPRMVSSVQALILPLVSELELLLETQPPEVGERLQMLKRALGEITIPSARFITSQKFFLDSA